METFKPLFAAHKHHEQSLEESVDVWKSRIVKLEEIREAGGGKMSEFTAARSAFASAQADLASVREKTAELQAARLETIAALKAAEANMEISLESAMSVLDIDSLPNDPQWWRSIGSIEVLATHAGVIETLDITNGAWADEQTNVLTIVQPDKLRFRASGLQSDLGVLRDGLQVNIVPPTPTSAVKSV